MKAAKIVAFLLALLGGCAAGPAKSETETAAERCQRQASEAYSATPLGPDWGQRALQREQRHLALCRRQALADEAQEARGTDWGQRARRLSDEARAARSPADEARIRADEAQEARRLADEHCEREASKAGSFAFNATMVDPRYRATQAFQVALLAELEAKQRHLALCRGQAVVVSPGPVIQPPPAPRYAPAPRTTNCVPNGVGGFHCSTF